MRTRPDRHDPLNASAPRTEPWSRPGRAAGRSGTPTKELLSERRGPVESPERHPASGEPPPSIPMSRAHPRRRHGPGAGARSRLYALARPVALTRRSASRADYGCCPAAAARTPSLVSRRPISFPSRTESRLRCAVALPHLRFFMIERPCRAHAAITKPWRRSHLATRRATNRTSPMSLVL
jgi:hypothetical protein